LLTEASQQLVPDLAGGLREIVQDAAGEWIERPSTLQLQEKAR